MNRNGELKGFSAMKFVRPSVARLTDSLSLADVREFVRRDTALPRRRREDMVSATNTAARVLGRDAADIPADPILLSRRLGEASLAEHDVRPPRWANVRSLLSTALALVVPVLPCRQTHKLGPAWQALGDKLMERYGQVRLSSLMHYCSARDIPPEDVDQATFDAFATALANSLRKDPAETYREMVRAWNRAVTTIPGWPGFRATCPSRKRTWTLPWSAFPELAQDKDAWLSRFQDGEREEVDEHDDDEQGKEEETILRPRTVKAMDHMLREAASALVHRGWDKARFTQVKDFGTLEAFKAVRRGMKGQHRDHKVGPHIVNVLWMLKAIAHHETKAEAPVLAAMKKIIKHQPATPPGLTDKNLHRLKPFNDPAVVEKFRRIPELLMQEAHRLTSPAKTARCVQMALAVDLLQVTLMRVGNLAGLDLEENFIPGGAGLWIWIPKEKAKGKRSLEFPLPQQTLDILAIYRRDHRRVLVTTPTTALFPGRNAGGRQSAGFGTQIIRVIKRCSGLTINPHLFRHIGAKLYLDAHPGDYETVRRMLSHASLDVTTAYYTGLEAIAAFRLYHKDVLQRGSGEGDRR